MRAPALRSVAVAALLTGLAAVAWGTSFPVNHVGLSVLDPGTFSVVRFAVAAFSAAVVAALLGRLQPRLLLRWDIWALGLFNAGGFLLQYVAQEATTPAKAALLINANAVVVAVLAVVMLRERLSGILWAGIIMAIVGVFFLTTEGQLGALFGGNLLGDFLAFLAGAVWSVFIVLNKRFVDERGGGADLVSVSVAIFTATTVWAIPVAWWLWPESFLHVPAAGWWPILYVGAVCSTFAYVVWSFALQRLSASVSAVILLLEVPVAAALSILLGYERLSVPVAVGGLLLFAAIAWVSLYEARREPIA